MKRNNQVQFKLKLDHVLFSQLQYIMTQILLFNSVIF